MPLLRCKLCPQLLLKYNLKSHRQWHLKQSSRDVMTPSPGSPVKVMEPQDEQNEHFEELSQNQEDETVRCTLCPRLLLKHHLKKHLQWHLKHSPSETMSLSEEDVSPNIVHSKRLIKTSAKKQNLKKMTKSSKLQATKHCQNCKETFENSQAFGHHMANHIAKCPLCDHKDKGKEIR